MEVEIEEEEVVDMCQTKKPWIQPQEEDNEEGKEKVDLGGDGVDAGDEEDK